ncbi:MAG: hypothetical protein K2H86_03265, partial [Muribaculaceae bacterium]|nr:hypothetical protein [Muribaculaceae bacterium]
RGLGDGYKRQIVLEKPDHAGYWRAIDSARVSKTGKFHIESAAPGAPEIYRLRYDGEYIYFPIDSIETVKVTSSADRFGTDFTLDGTENAKTMARFEKDLIAFGPYIGNPDSLAAFKKHVYTDYMQNANGSIVSYYILTKVIGDRALYGEDGDDRYIAAVATAFRQFRPNDPRTALLESQATRMRRERNSRAGKQTVVEAPEVNLVEITLSDEDGREQKLSSYVGGKPTLLIFCDLSNGATAADNVKLRSRVAQGGFKVYQVGMDDDKLQWRNSAKNLPWMTVYGGGPDAVALARSYMLNSLPAYFIIDSQGTLRERVADLQTALNKLP